MKRLGRPSKEMVDRERLVTMINRWNGPEMRRTARYLSRVAFGLEVISGDAAPKHSANEDACMRPRPSSEAKRLERRFLELEKSGDAEALLAYRTWHRYRLQMRNEEQFDDADMNHNEAAVFAAKDLGVEVKDLQKLSLHGWKILESWFSGRNVKPNYYD